MMLTTNALTKLLMICLLVAAIIHIVPVTGVIGAAHLHDLYGVTLTDSNLLILMRHRAVVFALLGCLLLYAAFKPMYQSLAITAGLISTFTFLWLAWSADTYNAHISQVVTADIIAIISLCGAGLLKVWMATR